MDVIETATEHALIALLWTEWDGQYDDGEPLDANYDTSDVAPESRESLRKELESFYEACGDDLASVNLSAEQVGHDFILTRNGHGAGFWDRGLGDAGGRLTDMCKPYGNLSAYVGDDGKIYTQ